jgi:hypothetical protein
MPELPSQTLRQASSSRLPTGETMPIPVMTTRRLLNVLPLEVGGIANEETLKKARRR